MGAVQSSGYISNDYTQNPDGTFTCNLNTLTYPLDITSNPVIINIKCIGTSNVNNIKSINHPNQMILMSADNKYIFYNIITEGSSSSINIGTYIFNYFITLGVVNYNIKIPFLYNYSSFIQALGNWPDPNDSIYKNIPEKNSDNSINDQKNLYKGYLMGLNPPNNLLTVNSDKTVWSDLGYIMKSVYDLKLTNNNNNLLLSTLSYCIKVESPSVISYVSSYDCRSVTTNASPIIKASNSLDFSILSNNNIAIGIGVSVLLFVFCISSVCAFVLMRKRR